MTRFLPAPPLRALEYSEPLRRRVDGWQDLVAGEPAEVDIRAATVVAVELRAAELDWILWDLSQTIYPARPYYRTRTMFY